MNYNEKRKEKKEEKKLTMNYLRTSSCNQNDSKRVTERNKNVNVKQVFRTRSRVRHYGVFRYFRKPNN